MKRARHPRHGDSDPVDGPASSSTAPSRSGPRTPRFHVPGWLAGAGDVIRMPADVAHHASRVLRLGSGSRIEIFDGSGGHALATLVDDAAHEARVTSILPAEARPALPLGVVQALSTSDRMDWTIEKSVELGAVAFHPVTSERTALRLDEARARKRHEHWQRIIAAASAQSGRSRLCSLSPLRSLRSAVTDLAGTHEPTGMPRLIHLDPDADRTLPGWVRERLAPSAGTGTSPPVVLICGPEAGLSAVECDWLERVGSVPLRMGPRVLRTESAAPAALAALQALAGDWN